MLFDNIAYFIIGKNDNILEVELQSQATLIAEAQLIFWHDTELKIDIVNNDGYEVPAPEAQDEALDQDEISQEEDLATAMPKPDEQEDKHTNSYMEELEQAQDNTTEEIENKGLVEKFWGVLKKSFIKATQRHSPKEEAEEDKSDDIEAPTPIEMPAPVFEEEDEPFESPSSEPEPTYPFYFAHCTNPSEEIKKIAFMTHKGGEVIALDLAAFDNNELILQAKNFVCCQKGVKIEVFYQNNAIVCSETHQPFTLLHLTGEKLLFLQTAYEFIERELDNDAIMVNLNAIIAFEGTIELDIDKLCELPNIHNKGNNFLVMLAGTGKVWLQNIPLNVWTNYVAPAINTNINILNDTDLNQEAPPPLQEQNLYKPAEPLAESLKNLPNTSNDIAEEIDHLGIENLEDIIAKVKVDKENALSDQDFDDLDLDALEEDHKE